MVHLISAYSLLSIGLAGFIVPAAFPGFITHKRNGALHFARVGRLSVSWCVRKV